MKVLDWLDRYQKVAQANRIEDEEIRDKMLDRLNGAARALLKEEREAREAQARAEGVTARRMRPEILARRRPGPSEAPAQGPLALRAAIRP